MSIMSVCKRLTSNVNFINKEKSAYFVSLKALLRALMVPCHKVHSRITDVVTGHHGMSMKFSDL